MFIQVSWSSIYKCKGNLVPFFSYSLPFLSVIQPDAIYQLSMCWVHTSELLPVDVCVCVTANLCNGIIFKILGPCEGKNTLSLVRESRDLQENSSMAEILQSKVKKNVNFCPLPYFLSHVYPL